MEKKSSLQVIDEFTEKIKRLKNSNNFSISENESKNSSIKNLKNKIDEIQIAEDQKILSQYNAFVKPVSKQIEDDENELLECFEFFLKLNFKKNELLNYDFEDSNNLIYVNSSIPKKNHYTTGTDFIFLCAWFKYEMGKTEFVPRLVKNDSGFFRLTFINAENATFSIEERRILNFIERKVL